MTGRRLFTLVALPFAVLAVHLATPPVPGWVEVTPDTALTSATAHASGWTESFLVKNTRSVTTTYNLSCDATGQVTCGTVNPTQVTLTPNQQIDVDVSYSTGNLSPGKWNHLRLIAAYGGVIDTGFYQVTINTSVIKLESPGTGSTRLVVHNRQPVIRAQFLNSLGYATDTTGTVLKWRDTVITSLTRHNRGLIEWEVDSTRWLGIGDSARLTIEQRAGAITTTEQRWVVLVNDSTPVIGFTGMPLETLNGGFGSGFGPGLSVNGAEIETGFSAIPYVSMGNPRSAGLVYSTRTSYPRALVNADIELPWPAAPSNLKVYLWDGAVKMDSAVFTSPSLTPCTQGAVKRCRVSLQADFSGSTFATPTRKWLKVEVQVTSGSTRSSIDSVEVVLVDRRATQYGSGWWPSGISRLYAAGSDRILVGPSGSATIFRGSGDSVYVSPPGSFTALVKTASGWELRPRGSNARVRFDSNGRLSATADANGNKDSVVYVGSTDTVTTLRDPLGKTISFTYTSGKLSKITTLTSTAARDVFVNVDGNNQLVSYRLPYSASSTGGQDSARFQYQAYPGTKTYALTRYAGMIGDTTRVVYDSTFTRRPVQVFLPRVQDETGTDVTPDIEYYAYERQGYHVLRSLDSVYVEIKDPRDNWTRSLLNRWAQTRRTWDALGLIGKTQYDPDGFVVWSEGKNGDSSRTYTVYDALRRVVKSYIVRTASDTLRGDSLVYDANHRVLKRINNLGQRDSMVYDANGNLTKMYNAAGQVAQTWYRSDGLVDSSQAIGASSRTRFSYEVTWKNVFRVTDQSGTVISETTYDIYGRGTTVQNKVRVRVDGDSTRWQWRKTVAYLSPLNLTDSTTLYRTDTCNDPCSYPPAWPADSDTVRTQHVRFRRDRGGRDSLRINDRGIATRYLHDRLGRLLSRRPWTDSSAVKDSMVYDVAGNLRKTITRRGHTIQTYYDSRNRDTLTTIPGVGDKKSVFGGPLDQLTRLYHASPVDSIGGLNAEVRWGYDQRGRLKADTSYSGTSAEATSYVVDRYERDSVMTDVSGNWITRYDATLGLPIKLVTPFSDSVVYGYDSQMRVTGPTVLSSGPTQTVTPYFSVTNGLDSLNHTVSTTPSAFTPLSYSNGVADEPSFPSSAPFWKEQFGAGATVDTLRDSVAYDGWERVTSMVTFRNGTEVSRDTFRFDRTGNILSTGGSEVYDAVTGRLMSRFANTWTYTYYYDRAGNPDSVIKTKAGLTERYQYGWDALNRLVSVRNNGTLIARYAYDVLGRRIAKRVYSATTGGTVGYLRFVYHGDHVAFERDSVNALGKRYVWGMGTDDLIGYWLPPNKMYYVVKDKLGSIRSIVIRAGTWQYSERFGPYGESIEFNGTDQGLRYRWTGREYDAETGWYFHRARYYEPAARRFVQEDPIGYAGSSNVYSYVDGRSLQSRDPSGLRLEDPVGEMWWSPGTMQDYLWGQLASMRTGSPGRPYHPWAYIEQMIADLQARTQTTIVSITYADGSTREFTVHGNVQGCSNSCPGGLSADQYGAALTSMSWMKTAAQLRVGNLLSNGQVISRDIPDGYGGGMVHTFDNNHIQIDNNYTTETFSGDVFAGRSDRLAFILMHESSHIVQFAGLRSGMETFNYYAGHRNILERAADAYAKANIIIRTRQ